MPRPHDPAEVLVLADQAGEIYLIGRKSFALAAIDPDDAPPDGPPLRAIGTLDPTFPIATLGIRTVLGVPAPVVAVPGILDEGEAQLALDLDGGTALLAREMLENVRIRPADHDRVRAALKIAAGQ